MKLDPLVNRVLDQENILSVFGLILFTDEHPHIAKVLADETYWRQFDKISGNSFAIFSAKPKSGKHEKGFMCEVWEEPSENEKLLETFHLESTEKLPQFIVFAQMPDDSILQCSIQLSDESTAAAHQRLKQVIETVSLAAKGIAPEYKAQTEDVFKAFASQIQGFKERQAMIAVLKWVPFVGKVVRMLR